MRSGWSMTLGLLVATNLSAGEAGWTAPATVAAVEVNQHARFTVRLNLKTNVSGCRDADTFYVDYGRAGSELMYETAADALQKRLKVQVYVTGGCDLNGYSAISAIRLLP